MIAKVATQLQPPQDEDWRAAKELLEIWRMFKQNAQFTCQQIPRSQNGLADRLANKGRLNEGQYTGFTFPI